MTDPIQLVDRFEELTCLIEKRIYDHTQEFDPSQTVQHWLRGLYQDRDLAVWDRERMRLMEMLPLGYFWDQQ